ncbi:hypothetical protein HDV02_001944 [Globomyces sp. JEL0801]|nr:hypothetical protein HDV02_001944 [Globomyces sp. JEL0801]
MNDEFLQQLETEIENYDKNLQLNDNENILRYWIIIRLKQLLHTKFTDFRIDIFGSFGYESITHHSTGCSLSDGDLDLSIHIEDTQHIDLGYIRSLCFRAYWIDVDTIEYISHTRVPVLKFKTTAWAGCISVDIVINRVSGLDSSCCVIDWFKRYSFLKPLVLVLKQYLKINHLDVVYNGGLGGFALINMLMVLVHLESDPNLGFPKARYLVKFFYLTIA